MKSEFRYPKIMIIGLGNLLLRDDGVGVHAVRKLQENPLAGIVIAEVGTSVIHAQQLLEEADEVIAIDAVHADGPAGSIYRFEANDEHKQPHISLHDLGIIGVLKLMDERTRPNVTILGVEPEIIEYGMELSETVDSVLPQLVQVARNVAEQIKEREYSPSVESRIQR